MAWPSHGRLTVSQLCEEIEEGIGVRFAFPCFSAQASKGEQGGSAWQGAGAADPAAASSSGLGAHARLMLERPAVIDGADGPHPLAGRPRLEP